MRLFIDANIIVDVFQKREPHFSSSYLIWRICDMKIVDGFSSILTFSNIVYIMRKELDADKIEKLFNEISEIITFVNYRTTDAEKAAKLMKWKDFEDAIQSTIAERIKADYIITRNVKDFQQSSVKAITPDDFIENILLSI